ncbi:hypothetical protein [Sabulibacter ruber]|uniref:hypothetical protein n=1 Tax=Sabulibacter ruber TaxID=2811901 RepID=UPI001A964EFA|nr:hypothetical protein [Sabulibacter ruber]
MSRETATVEKEEEYIPLLKFVKILSERGVNITIDSVGRGMAICSFKCKMDDQGNWHIAKEELLRRIKASGKKWPPIEKGYYSIYGFIWELSLHGIDFSEDQLHNQMYYGKIDLSKDDYGRWVIPQHELDKRLEQFGGKK